MERSFNRQVLKPGHPLASAGAVIETTVALDGTMAEVVRERTPRPDLTAARATERDRLAGKLVRG